MRIDGLPNLSKVSQSTQRNDAARQKGKPGRADDSVEISSTAKQAVELGETLKTAPEQANPRIAEVRERVQSGYYNSEQVRREIAGALLDSSGSLREVVDEVAEIRTAHRQLDEVPEVRADRVDQTRARAASGFYDQPQVRLDTAQSIIDESA